MLREVETEVQDDVQNIFWKSTACKAVSEQLGYFPTQVAHAGIQKVCLRCFHFFPRLYWKKDLYYRSVWIDFELLSFVPAAL